jgi:anti-anti-sigma regulatory factor
MVTTQLRRTRGSLLEISAPRHARRPCRPGLPVVFTDARGRFSIAVERLGADDAAMRLGGELDLAAVPALDGALRRAERWAVSSLLVDTGEVGFLDLGSITRLTRAHERLAAHGGGVLVVNPPECLLRVLELLEELDLPVLLP